MASAVEFVDVCMRNDIGLFSNVSNPRLRTSVPTFMSAKTAMYQKNNRSDINIRPSAVTGSAVVIPSSSKSSQMNNKLACKKSRKVETLQNVTTPNDKKRKSRGCGELKNKIKQHCCSSPIIVSHKADADSLFFDEPVSITHQQDSNLL